MRGSTLTLILKCQSDYACPNPLTHAAKIILVEHDIPDKGTLQMNSNSGTDPWSSSHHSSPHHHHQHHPGPSSLPSQMNTQYPPSQYPPPPLQYPSPMPMQPLPTDQTILRLKDLEIQTLLVSPRLSSLRTSSPWQRSVIRWGISGYRSMNRCVESVHCLILCLLRVMRMILVI